MSLPTHIRDTKYALDLLQFVSDKPDARYLLDLICILFDKLGITFSRTVAAKIVGGEYRLKKLVMWGEIRMDKPTAKQNGKWFCNGADVMKHIRLR